MDPRIAFSKAKQVEAQRQVLERLRGGGGISLQGAAPFSSSNLHGGTPAYAAKLGGRDALVVRGGGQTPKGPELDGYKGGVNVGGRIFYPTRRGNNMVYVTNETPGQLGGFFPTAERKPAPKADPGPGLSAPPQITNGGGDARRQAQLAAGQQAGIRNYGQDWRDAANYGSKDPNSLEYWNRQDMFQWRTANAGNKALADREMAKYGLSTQMADAALRGGGTQVATTQPQSWSGAVENISPNEAVAGFNKQPAEMQFGDRFVLPENARQVAFQNFAPTDFARAQKSEMQPMSAQAGVAAGVEPATPSPAGNIASNSDLDQTIEAYLAEARRMNNGGRA